MVLVPVIYNKHQIYDTEYKFSKKHKEKNPNTSMFDIRQNFKKKKKQDQSSLY